MSSIKLHFMTDVVFNMWFSVYSSRYVVLDTWFSICGLHKILPEIAPRENPVFIVPIDAAYRSLISLFL